VIRSGAALDKMRAIVAAQGGDAAAVDDPSRLPTAPARTEVRVRRAGWIATIDAEEIGLAAMGLGAGRDRADANVDPAVGVVLTRKVGDRVAKGDVIAVVHHRGGEAAPRAAARVLGAYALSARRPPARPLVLEVVR
jgi:thymidine phosphorylase